MNSMLALYMAWDNGRKIVTFLKRVPQRETDRQTERQTDRQRDRERERE